MAKTPPPAALTPAQISQMIAASIAQIGAGGSSSSGSSGDPLIYLGPPTPGQSGSPSLIASGPEGNLRPNQHLQVSATSGTMSLSQAQIAWFNWSDAEKLNLAKRLFSLGYITSPSDIYGARDKYFGAMQDSANSLIAGKHPMTPLQILDAGAGANADVLKTRLQAGPGSITTSNPVNLMDRANVLAMATSALQNALGRGPTDAEVNTFFNTMHEKQLSDRGSTTVTRDANGNVSSQVSTPGYTADDAQQYLLSKIQNSPEFAKYQAGTTYFQAAMQANAAIGGA